MGFSFWVYDWVYIENLETTRGPFGSRVFLLEEIMTAFRGNRVVHEFTQTNPAAPERVFPAALSGARS